MSMATHTQGSMALLLSTADHLALSRILQRQASARGLDVKWHDSDTSDPEAILASMRTQGRHVSLVIFGGSPPFEDGRARNTANPCWPLHAQNPSAWTHQLDLRRSHKHD